jgi:cell division cycle 14
MSSPSSTGKDGALKPSFFIDLFIRNKVRSVVRLNETMYNHDQFERENIEVHDMEFPDGSNPPDYIIIQFIQLCEREN